MKKILFPLFLLLFCISGFAQTDSSAVEQYCTVIATPRLLSSRVTIDIDYGERRSMWKDNRLKDEDGRVKKFNTVVDALNYMGNEGWQLVNAFPYTNGGNTYTYHYTLKKKFLKSEAEEE